MNNEIDTLAVQQGLIISQKYLHTIEYGFITIC